jgi:aspartate/methionine/tyrosine aminotransferase
MPLPEQSRRVSAVQSPVIPVVAEMIREHPGTISLGQGVVHYEPPPEVAARMAEFWSDGANHKYGHVQGIVELTTRIANKLRIENAIDSDCYELVVTAGSNMGFFTALLAIADPGDEIIILSPYYFNHEMAIRMVNCEPVLVPTGPDYQPDLDAIEKAISPRTRAIVTISPNNPTGAVYSETDLRAINTLCRDRGIFHISDEPYEYFVYADREHFSPGSIDGAEDYTISLFSLSKSFGFASWRVGYMVLPEQLLGAVKKIQDTYLICPPLINQYAARGALEAGRGYCAPYIDELDLVRRAVLESLEGLGAQVTVPEPQGAFYVLIELKSVKIKASELVAALIRQHRVAAIPGDAFGIDDRCCLRISYGALKTETVMEGVGRLVAGLSQLLI